MWTKCDEIQQLHQVRDLQEADQNLGFLFLLFPHDANERHALLLLLLLLSLFHHDSGLIRHLRLPRRLKRRLAFFIPFLFISFFIIASTSISSTSTSSVPPGSSPSMPPPEVRRIKPNLSSSALISSRSRCCSETT